MKTQYLLASALLAFSTSTALAGDLTQMVPTVPAEPVIQAVPQLPVITNDPALDESIRGLQSEWAVIKYQVQNSDEQEKQMAALADKAASLDAKYPTYAEPKVWHAIILSSQAGIQGGLGALGLVEDAKELLESAKKINPDALDGSVYTSLGSLYYKVPAWPVAFGDSDKARKYLEKAIALNPNGIDPNYFYGDFLNEQGEYKKAVTVLEHALEAAPRQGRELADAGRKQEINVAITRAQHELEE